MHLQPKRVRETQVRTPIKKAVKIEILERTRDQINIYTLFEEFMKLRDFSCGEGIVCEDVPTWISERKRAYKEFQKRFSEQEMGDLKTLHDNYKDFLYFRNNMSWTTLYRSGMKALNHLESLRKLLTFLQKDSVPAEERVCQGLGECYVEGIGIGILTGLLHMFYPDKYGVWNSRTTDTLNMIKRNPVMTSNIGHSYLLINKELKQLGEELKTDLTTIDGFMWFISKKIKIIQ